MLRVKKGQGLSMNVIIVAAIALIVLVVIVFIFTGRIKVFGGTISNCGAQGGVCKSLGSQCFTGDPLKYQSLPNCGCGDAGASGSALVKGTDCEKNQEICCVPVIET